MGKISDVLSQVKQAGDQAVQDSKAVAGKQQMVRDLNAQSAASIGGVAKAPALQNGDAPAARPSKGDLVNKGGAKFGSRPGEQRIDTSGMKPLGSFKKGGKVKKTGVYKLHKKERVLNAKQTAKVEKAGGIAAALAGKTK